MIRLIAKISTAIVLLIVCWSLTGAYERYNGGCQNCHGAFTGPVSPTGAVFPGDDKHNMHRSSSYMNADCDLCHTSGDGRNPFLGSSNGTNDNPGLGCTGCHERNGLRAHHLWAEVSTCLGCHDDPPPPPENVAPAYYGTVDTNAAMPCNPVAQANVNENWSIADAIGLDNDGDGLYDGNDPDCGGSVGTPGEALGLLVTAHDAVGGALTVGYDNMTCETTGYNFYFGSLDQVSSLAYSGQDCGIGASGSFEWSYGGPSPGSAFFLVVAVKETVEGSYGTNATAVERTPSGLCPENQELADRCDAP